MVLEKTLLRVPWTARQSNQSILKETNPEYSLEGLMIKLKLQQSGHLHRVNSLEKILMLGKMRKKEKGTACLTLCDPMDYSLPGSSVHRDFQA